MSHVGPKKKLQKNHFKQSTFWNFSSIYFDIQLFLKPSISLKFAYSPKISATRNITIFYNFEVMFLALFKVLYRRKLD